MSEMIGKYGPIATEAESYSNGYEDGRTWQWPHVPGGPFVFRGSVHNNDSNWLRYCERSAANNREWLRGWHDGRTAQ